MLTLSKPWGELSPQVREMYVSLGYDQASYENNRKEPIPTVVYIRPKRRYISPSVIATTSPRSHEYRAYLYKDEPTYETYEQDDYTDIDLLAL